MRKVRLLPVLVLAATAQAQLAPVVGARGVVNAFTQEPAPSSVAPGGLIWINGLNFGAAGDVKVLVNGAQCRVISQTGTRIAAQLPADLAQGLAEVVVERAGARSRPAKVVVATVVPSVRTADDTGSGEAAANISGDSATLTAGGFGQDAAPPIVAHVGGLPAAADLIPGASEIKVALPSGWQSGDVISLRAAMRTANRTVLRKAARPEITFLRLPSGATELRSLAASDLRGGYVIGSSARDAQGCVPSYLFDTSAKSVKPIDGCLIAAAPGGGQGAPQPAAQIEISPVTAESEGSGLAALVGPAEGQPPAGVSSKVLVLHPERADPITVQLQSAASSLTAFASEGITAVLAGDTPRRVTIDTRTGQVRELAGPAIVPGEAGFRTGVDLGDGLNQVLSVAATGADGSTGLVVGDSAENPTRMKFAIVSPQGEIAAQSFPENWLALMGPAQSAPAGIGAGGPGLGAIPRTTVVAHAESNEFYVLARNSSDSAHALVAFAKAAANPRVVRFPEGWFAAACTSRVPVYTFQLSSTLAVPATQTQETESKNPCLARAMLVAEPAAEQATLLSFPAQAPLNLAGSTGSINDFVYGGNAANADTLVVYDGAMGAVSQLNPPAGVSTYSGLTQIASMNALIAPGTKQTQGDAGFVLFDLERGEARSLSLPDGFSRATSVGVFPVTRKFAATGIRTDGAGSQLIVYDLVSGDATVVSNPEGVAWIGSVVQQTPSGGQFPGLPGVPFPGGGQAFQAAGAGLLQANPKANSIAAVAFDSERKQVGVIGVRIH